MTKSTFPHLWVCALLMLTALTASERTHAQCDSLDFNLLCEDGDMVNDAIFSCGFSCIFAGDLATCFSDCIAAGIPTMSTGCVGCFAEQSTCAQENCFLVCGFGSTADCEACVLANCQAQFESCAGIVDADGDGEDVICDCDDADAATYPGAPGTSSGLDNNCDGVISADELACLLDLTGDLLVSVSDVLVVLSEFGCLVGCAADITGDGAVTVSDVLELLGGFGDNC
jgi:hypothetical protein